MAADTVKCVIKAFKVYIFILHVLIHVAMSTNSVIVYSFQSDVMLSFLPLAHMLERCCEVSVYIAGGAVGFFSGDIRNLVDDYKTLRPTITPSVPRLLNRVYDKVTTAVNGSAVKKLMMKMAVSSKRADLER